MIEIDQQGHIIPPKAQSNAPAYGGGLGKMFDARVLANAGIAPAAAPTPAAKAAAEKPTPAESKAPALPRGTPELAAAIGARTTDATLQSDALTLMRGELVVMAVLTEVGERNVFVPKGPDGKALEGAEPMTAEAAAEAFFQARPNFRTGVSSPPPPPADPNLAGIKMMFGGRRVEQALYEKNRTKEPVDPPGPYDPHTRRAAKSLRDKKPDFGIELR